MALIIPDPLQGKKLSLARLFHGIDQHAKCAGYGIAGAFLKFRRAQIDFMSFEVKGHGFGAKLGI